LTLLVGRFDPKKPVPDMTYKIVYVISPVGKEKVYGGKDLLKSQVSVSISIRN